MKRIKEFVIRNIAGEEILVPTGKTATEFSGMITLNATASFIWQHIDDAPSFDALIYEITEEFEIEETIARKDAYNFIMNLLANRMVATEREDHTW